MFAEQSSHKPVFLARKSNCCCSVCYCIIIEHLDIAHSVSRAVIPRSNREGNDVSWLLSRPLISLTPNLTHSVCKAVKSERSVAGSDVNMLLLRSLTILVVKK